MAAAFFTVSCSGKVKVIPEISNALYDDVLGEPFKGANTIGTIIARDSNLVFFTLEGKIYRFNLEKNILDFLVDLAIPVEPVIIHQKDTVVLKEKNSANFIFFDLRRMSAIEMPQKINAEKIISIDAENEIIGYLTGQRLVFMNYASGKILAELNIEAGAGSGKKESDGNIIFYNSVDTLIDGAPKTLVLSSRDYIFNKQRNSIETIKLESKASSGFLSDGWGHLLRIGKPRIG